MQIDTAGGSYTAGNVATQGGHFIGRDLNLNVELTFTGAEMRSLLAELLALLRERDTAVQAGEIIGSGKTLAVSPAQVEALGKYMAAVPAETGAQREANYLARLCVDPAYRQWQTRYIALSGGYRPAPVLTPSYSEVLVRGEGPQRQVERVNLPDIRLALDKYPAFILLAQPGAGKTTVLQRLALDQALARLRDPAATRLPLLVRLAAQKPEESPQQFLARMWRQEMPGETEDDFVRCWQQGRLCLLADALNEARREKYSERMVEWRELAATLPAGNRLVFSCRTQDYYGELALQQVEIDPLTDKQIEEFACRYLDDQQGHAFRNELHGNHATVLPLARIPYYLRMMVDDYAEGGHMSPVRGAMFAGFVRRLFTRERDRNHEDWIDPAAQHLALSQLAFAMQHLGEGTEVTREWATNALPQTIAMPGREPAPTSPASVLHLACAATLLSETPQHSYKFSHHLLQEYFAAEELLRCEDRGDDLAGLWRVASAAGEVPEAERGEWDPLPGPPTTGWEQTTILAAGLMPELIEVVGAVNPALAARCVLESGLNIAAGEIPPEQVEACRQQMLARLGDVAIHLRSRIEAGLLLGRLKDPRFPVEMVGGVRVIAPPMVEIAAAEAAIGSGTLDFKAFGNERPRHKVPLAAYALGRYPVTNAEYACFIDAGGYQEERYWTAGGTLWRRGEPVRGEEDPVDSWMEIWKRWKQNPTEIDEREKGGLLTPRDADLWRKRLAWTDEYALGVFRQWYPQGQAVKEPRFWQDEDFNILSQPVVGVCWYEAAAYANWLAALTGLPYRLLSEPEWEWAARRGARSFPWGRGWDLSRLNSLEGRVMRTTPVGVYPQGATPDGLHDLAGNVWEWTATRYARYPYDSAADLENPNATGLRVARGGGWTANRRMVRCAYRNWLDPRDWNSDLGLRLARSLS